MKLTLRRTGLRGSLLLFVIGIGLFVGGGAALASFYISTKDNAAAVCSPENSSLQTGLIGCWKFDGNAKDSSGGGNDGTVFGATLTADRFNLSNRAYNFVSTSSQYINLPGPSSITTDATITGWFTFTPASTAVLWRDNTANPGQGWLLMDNSGNFSFRVGGTQFDTGISVAAYAGTWTHYAVTAAGGSVALYINGSQVYTGSGAASSAPLMPWRIMRNGSNAQFTSGSADDLRIYNRALSGAEISTMYSEGAPPPIHIGNLQNGLTGQWKFDGNAMDSTPYSDNGTTTGVSLTTDREGAANKAYSFDGSTSFVQAPDNAKMDTTTGTWCAWIKLNNYGTSSVALLSKASSISSVRGITLVINTSGLINAQFKDNTGTTLNLVSNTTLPTSSWHLITLTFNGTGTATIYLDAVSVASGTASSWSFGSWNFRIGKAADSFWSVPNGSIDEVRTYNRALSLTEIQQLYNDYNSQIRLSGT